MPRLERSRCAAPRDLSRSVTERKHERSYVWSAVLTVAIVKLLGMTVGLRVGIEEQREGLDLATHGERAYDLM